VSLIAVFLALGLGILIGTIVVQDPEVLQAQDNLIKQLSADLKRLDEQNAQSQARLEAMEKLLQEFEAFANDVFPLLISNRLFGRNIALVCLDRGESEDDAAALKDTLTAAGASVRVVTLHYPLADFQSRLKAFGFGDPRRFAEDIDYKTVAEVLAKSAIVGYEAGLVRQLADAGYLTVENPEDYGATDSVVLLAGDGTADSALLSLADALGGCTVLLLGRFEGDGLRSLGLDMQSMSHITVMSSSPGIPARYRLIMSLAGE